MRKLACALIALFLFACAGLVPAQAQQQPSRPQPVLATRNSGNEPIYRIGFHLQKNRVLDIFLMWEDNGGQDLCLVIRTVLTPEQEMSFRQKLHQYTGQPLLPPSRIKQQFPAGVFAFRHEARLPRTGELIWSRTSYRGSPERDQLPMPRFMQESVVDVPPEVLPTMYELLDRVAGKLIIFGDVSGLIPTRYRSLLQGRLYAYTAAR